MVYTADMIGKRNSDCINGRDWFLNHLRKQYGSGELQQPLKWFRIVSKTLYPRELSVENWAGFAWTDHPETTYEQIADVLNKVTAILMEGVVYGKG